MQNFWRRLGGVLFLLAGVASAQEAKPAGALAAGVASAGATVNDGLRSGRVLVVANASSPASLELAAAYREARGLPLVNQLAVKVSNPATLSAAEFTKALQQPVQQRLAALGGAVDYVVLCRDVPYRVETVSATTALMFGGLEEIQPTQGYYQQDRAFEGDIPCHLRRLLPGTVLSACTVDEGLALIRNSQVRYPDARQA
ncbi:MAG: hypothetical protein WC708_12320, partial [Lentisphaeria bacterium]